jgi:transposase
MRKLKEILRLHFVVGLSQRQIARSCSVSKTTVAEYLSRTQAAKLSWQEIQQLSEVELTRCLFPLTSQKWHRIVPDCQWIHQQLRRPHVTLQLLWQEYKLKHPDGYQYTRFCDYYRQWKKSLDVSLRQSYRGGEKMFVDYAGDTVEIVNPESGEITPAQIFVAVLGASNYTYAKPTLKQDLSAWIQAHVCAFEFFGGTPKILIPDNARTAVTKACRYEPQLNPTYADLAAHYQVAVIPARPRKPRDKAKVEAAVLVVERWILAALRNRTFFSLAELNQAIQELLEDLNNRPFKKLPATRRQLFEQLDRPLLRPLPPTRYQFSQWEKARVNIDYHVELTHHYYSVPYALVGESVDLCYTSQTVSIFHQGKRVAIHRRDFRKGQHTTEPQHRPTSHRRYLEWTPSRLIDWGRKIGPSTATLIERILAARRFPEQGYRSCLGLLRLAKTFGDDRLEAACLRALTLNCIAYKSVHSILKTGLDQQPLPKQLPLNDPVEHPNLRGADYFKASQEDSHVY